MLTLALSAARLTAASGLVPLVIPSAGLQSVHLRVDALVSVAILGVFGTGATYVLNYRLISDDGATAASAVIYLMPVMSVLLGVIVLGEPPRLNVLAGAVVVLAGVVLICRHPRSAVVETAPSSRVPASPLEDR